MVRKPIHPTLREAPNIDRFFPLKGGTLNQNYLIINY